MTTGVICIRVCVQLINRDPDFRIGCGSGSGSSKAVSEIKEHPFFSKVSALTVVGYTLVSLI